MDFSTESIIFAFGLTLIAGLSTGIGSGIALFAKRTSKHFLSLSLGFSAGVMIFISLTELYPSALESVQEIYEPKTASILVFVAFFVGMGLIALIDKLIPSFENPHDLKLSDNLEVEKLNKSKLHRMGILSAIAIGIHNFPEGIATFIAGLSSTDISYPITFAIALHNIPEGIAVFVPIYFATNSKKKAFGLSLLSGLAEPIGALFALLAITMFFEIDAALMGLLFSFVAGIMVFISFDELIPTSKVYGTHHTSVYGLIAGMFVMALSLMFL